ncbi:hypothetical protein ACFE04_014773 [Oxalis oulophora]
MPPDCTSPPSSEVVRDRNETDLASDGLKFHFGGKLNFNEVDNTVEYVGGNTFSWGVLRPKEMSLKELYKIIYLFIEGEVVDVLSIHFKKPNVSLDYLHFVENDEDVAALTASWIEDGEVDIFVELTDKCKSMFIQSDGVVDDVGAGGIKDNDNHVDDDVEFDGDDENGDNSDEDDHFNVSLDSDSDEDDERIELIQNARSFMETAANIEPVLESIRQKATKQTVGGESDDNYPIDTNYMDDPNCNWSMDEEEEVVSGKNIGAPGNNAASNGSGGGNNDAGNNVAGNNAAGNGYGAGNNAAGNNVAGNNAAGNGSGGNNIDGGDGGDNDDGASEHGKDPDQLVSHWFKIDLYKELYSYQINPMESDRFWKPKVLHPLVPPPIRKKMGRPRMKRIPEDGEGTSTKMSKIGRIMRCGFCRQTGHRQNACPEKEKKLKEDAENEAAVDLDLLRNNVESSSKVKERGSQSNKKRKVDPSPSLSTPKKTKLTIGLTDVNWITKKRSPRKNVSNSQKEAVVPAIASSKLWKTTQIEDEGEKVGEKEENRNAVYPRFMVGPKLVKKKKRGTQ